jgi:selenium metabolism protein YedF
MDCLINLSAPKFFQSDRPSAVFGRRIRVLEDFMKLAVPGETSMDIMTVDARGLSCPQPVLETKRALEEAHLDRFLVMVDNPTSRENVVRFAKNQGFDVQVKENSPDLFEITIQRLGQVAEPSISVAAPSPEPTPNVMKNVIYVSGSTMGTGDDKLGIKLMRGFLRTLLDSEPKPWQMIFLNSGVYLTASDEEASEALILLEEKGVEILSCGTCLEHFELKEKLKVGKISNMYEIIETLNAATKVISPH